MKLWCDINVEFISNCFYFIIYGLLYFFCKELPIKITIGKGIRCTYKYDQHNWPYPYPNTNIIIPPRFDTSIQTQHKSAYDPSVSTNDLASDGVYQITNHNVNTDGKDNGDSQ